jgi:transcriptional regulator with XRE-family HTH domain
MINSMVERNVFEKLTGPLTVGKLLKAYRVTHALTVAELERKLRLSRGTLSNVENGRKKLTLKETVHLARKLEEYEEFYAIVWIKEQARDAGLNLDPYLRDPAD